MDLGSRYFDLIGDLLARVRDTNSAAIKAAGAAVAECIRNDGVLHVFGSGHSQIVAREIVNRAGGLVPVSQIVDPTGGWAEVLGGYGEKLFYRYAQQFAPREGDIAIVVSNSGANPSPVGVALACREAGLKVVTICNIAVASKATARHESGKRLFECADWSLDNCGHVGDAALELPGHDLKTGATSTFSGAMLMDLLVLEAIGILHESGADIPILQSANTGGRERNDRMSAHYRGRICRPI